MEEKYSGALVRKSTNKNVVGTHPDRVFYGSNQRVTGIPVPGNSHENQVNFFPLDLEKLFSISRSRLETQD